MTTHKIGGGEIDARNEVTQTPEMTQDQGMRGRTRGEDSIRIRQHESEATFFRPLFPGEVVQEERLFGAIQ